MIVEIESCIVGKESRVSQKGNRYEVVTFMDGAKPITAMLGEKVSPDKVVLYKPCILTLDIDFGKYTHVTVLGVSVDE